MSELKQFYRKDGGYLWWLCPGCDTWHGVPTDPPADTTRKAWSMTGTDEVPTLHPSLKVMNVGGKNKHCHFFLREGMIDFCNDSFHKLKGQKRVPVQFTPRFLWNEWDDEEE